MEILQETLLMLMQAVILIVVPIITPALTKFVASLAEHTMVHLDCDKQKYYLDELTRAVTDAVAHTSQTYVSGLKAGGMFSAAEQLAALEKAKQTALNSLTATAREFLASAHENLPQLVETKVEAAVNAQKADAAVRDAEPQPAAAR